MVDAQVAPIGLTKLLEEVEQLLGRHRELPGAAALVGGLAGMVNRFSRAGEQAAALQGVGPSGMLDHLLENLRIDGYGGHMPIRASSAGQHQWKTS